MSEVYVGYYFTITPNSPWVEILLAQLQELPFESFQMTENGLNAFVPLSQHSNNFLDSINLFQNKKVKIRFKKEKIKPYNWNDKWESSFKPIHIGSDFVIRSEFHPQFSKKYEIIINPKMCFGTGHHQTTYMMIEFALKEILVGKSVLDMGCGTGILAIVASKRGARDIRAIDNNPVCIENSIYNIKKNKCQNINVSLGNGVIEGKTNYDFIFANINRNVLLDQLSYYVMALNSMGGILFLSGFYNDNLRLIIKTAKKLGLRVIEKKEKDDWCALKFIK